MLDVEICIQWIQEHLTRDSKPELRAVGYWHDEPVLRFQSRTWRNWRCSTV